MLHATGNLTKNAEVREAGENSVAINFTIAEDRRVFKDGKYVKEAVFIKCTLWNREEIAQYLTTGVKVQVVGEVTAEAYNGEASLRVAHVLDIKFHGGGQRDNDQDTSRNHGNRNTAGGRNGQNGTRHNSRSRN